MILDVVKMAMELADKLTSLDDTWVLHVRQDDWETTVETSGFPKTKTWMGRQVKFDETLQPGGYRIEML